LDIISIDIPEINVVKVWGGNGKCVQYNMMVNRPAIFKHMRSKGVGGFNIWIELIPNRFRMTQLRGLAVDILLVFKAFQYHLD